MIFSPALARKVLVGSKTETRRPVREGKTCRYRVGHTYAVQPGRGRAEEGRILVTGVYEQRLGDIAFVNARAEGFRTTADFKAEWMRLYDKAWVAAHGAEDLDLADETVAQRFEDRHADTRVWVIQFMLPIDQIRLLADRHAKADYVDTPARAMPDEPEAVDEQTQERISKDARLRKAQQNSIDYAAREAELGLLTLGQRLDRVVASMRADRQAASSDVRVIEKRVQSIERKHYRNAA